MFTHLHVHSHYSLLNALPKIPALVERAKENGMHALALTDDANLYGAIEFYKTCQKNDIKPIIGVDFYVATRTRHDKVGGIDNRRYRLVLLAKNTNGYKNLMRLVSRAYTEGFYYKARIDRELLEEYKDDLVCIIPQFSGETSNHLKLNNYERAEEALNFYKKIFGDDLYFEVIHQPGVEGQPELQEKIIEFAKKHDQKIVATGDTYYLDTPDKQARDILVDVGNIKMGGGYHLETEDFSFHTEADFKKFFKDHPEALEHTQEIAEKCNVELNLGEWTFPEFELNEGETAGTQLRKLAEAGFAKRNLEMTDEYMNRLNYELQVIADKGYSTYFLVVSDLFRAAKERKIETNTRGSAAGCLTSYLIGITNIDPIEYKLPFERFLNPERPSPPDVDMDIADDKRDELIAYTREKYGEDRVAQIGTFGTMAARGSVRDAARAMGFPYQKGDQISKLIPLGKQGFLMTIKRALDETPELKDLYKSDKEAKEIIDMAQKIEGCARHISVHAAGVVIAPGPVTDYTPVQLDPKAGRLITQYNMHAVEDAGLLKYDFLGLKNLTIIHETMRRLRKTRGVEFDLQTIPLDDKKTFKMLSAGHTYGVFQMASDGMTKWLKELRPTTIHDINAMVALYRPGPMDFIPNYIERKYHPNRIVYPDPRMKKFLEDSLGLMIYQEDVMLIAVEIAGYSWLEADMFRKAMGKKIPEVMAEQEEKFTTGCIASGMDKQVVTKLWEDITKFAAYGFNKSHAASYGRVAYQTAYLKANYPSEYMAALLSADSGDNERIAHAVEECRVMGLPVLPPDVNESYVEFGVTAGETRKEDTIRFGLSTIKNFGDALAEKIVDDRKANGPYTSLEDFLIRNCGKELNKKSLEALALAGGLDCLEDRSLILGNLDELLLFAKENRDQNADQDSLFSMMSGDQEQTHLKLNPVNEQMIRVKTTGMDEPVVHPLPLSKKHKLYWEKQLLGLYVSGHPLEKDREKIISMGLDITTVKNSAIGIKKVIGVVDSIKEIQTKKGQTMAFVGLSDFRDSLEIVAFPDIYKETKHLMTDEAVLELVGKLSRKDGQTSLLLEKVKQL